MATTTRLRRCGEQDNAPSITSGTFTNEKNASTLLDSIPLTLETLWSEMSGHQEIPDQSPMITQKTFYGIINLLIRNHRVVCYLRQPL